jgi:hypothetical protein
VSAATWREWIAVHPAADLFPMLPDAELDALAKDIEANGLTNPLCLWRADETASWQLIDGRNRIDAMARLPDGTDRINGALTMANPYEGERTDPLAFVVSANILRRHLDAEQKRDLIAALVEADPSRSNRAIARLTKASDHTVDNVRKELEGRAQIAHVSMRTDTAGRQQPAHKPPVHRQPPAAVVHNTSPRSAAPISKEQQLRELREHPRTPAALVSNTAAPLLLARQIEDFWSGLKGRLSDVERIDRQLRLRLARDLVVALGIDPAELAASGGGGGAP